MSYSNHGATDSLAIDFAEGLTALKREFSIEPESLAGSANADLHINDVNLLIGLSQPGEWTVRGIAQSSAAPDSTVSSALDRLEARGLIARQRSTSDRRVMVVELTGEGMDLTTHLGAGRIELSRQILFRLLPEDRETLVRLIKLAARMTQS